MAITTTGRAVELEGWCSPVTEEPVLDPIAGQDLLHAGSSFHALRLDGDTVHLELQQGEAPTSIERWPLRPRAASSSTGRRGPAACATDWSRTTSSW